MEDTIDPAVGFVITVKPGDKVSRGDVLAVIHARDDAGIREGKRVLAEALTLGEEPGKCLDLVSVRIDADGSAPWVRPDSQW